MSCGNNSCRFGHRGMGTNGPCQCFSQIKPTAERLRVEKDVHLLKERNRELEAELAQARETIERLQRQAPEPWCRPEEK